MNRFLHRHKASRLAPAFLAVAVATSGCIAPRRASLTPVPVIPFSDGRNFMLCEDLYFISKKRTVVVPRGFVTDFASIPRAFWSGYLPTGPYQWAAVVHDYLYWEQATSREEADDIFLEAMTQSGVKPADRTIIYHSVRVAGGFSWDANAEYRARGLVRVIPKKYLRIPPRKTWEEYQREISASGRNR